MYATRCSVAFMLALACLMGQHLCKEDNQLATDDGDKEEGNDTLLYIGAIFPMTGESWQGGQGSKPAVDMALKDVNDRPDMLPGYKLNMVWNDSEVSELTLCKFGCAYAVHVNNWLLEAHNFLIQCSLVIELQIPC